MWRRVEGHQLKKCPQFEQRTLTSCIAVRNSSFPISECAYQNPSNTKHEYGREYITCMANLKCNGSIDFLRIFSEDEAAI